MTRKTDKSNLAALLKRATSHPDQGERQKAFNQLILDAHDPFFCLAAADGVLVVQLLDDGWMARYHVRVDGREPRIREVLIQPAVPPPFDDVPFTAKQWRGLRPGTAMAYVRAYLQESGDPPAKMYRHGQAQLAPDRPTRKARTPERERELARVARIYVEALASTSRSPSADAADRAGYSHSQMRDLIRQARERGLLTKGLGQGRPGGELTPTARSILGMG